MRLGDGAAGAGQKARAHAIRGVAEAQIEACRLDLAGHEIGRRDDRADVGQRADHPVGQDALVVGAKRERQARSR